MTALLTIYLLLLSLLIIICFDDSLEIKIFMSELYHFCLALQPKYLKIKYIIYMPKRFLLLLSHWLKLIATPPTHAIG